MTVNEYQSLARRTQPDYETNEERAFHAVFGLCSEAGEVAGLLQKKYQGHTVDSEHMVRELGDCLWMISEACDAFGVTMEMVMLKNITKLQERYPDGFDAERSLHRKEWDI